FTTSASDPDGNTPVMTMFSATLPGAASYIDNGDGTGSFDWTPTFGDSGSYLVTFYATDSVFATAVDSEQITITVGNINQYPVLASIGDQVTDESVQLAFTTSASDPDGDPPVMTMASATLPGAASYVDNGDGTGTFDWTPTFGDSGSYLVTFYATDSVFATAVDSEQITIAVNNVNQYPVLAAIGDKATNESVQLTFTTSASDADGNTPVMAMFSATLPGAASYIDNGDGTGAFDWTPTFGDSGSYLVTFYATDSVFATAVDSEQITITVNNLNRAPVADAGPDQSGITVFSLVTLDGTGSYDLDDDPVNYSWVQIGGAVVVLSSAADSQPTFTPVVNDNFIFELTVDDGSLFSIPDTVVIAVTNASPPVAINDLSIQIVADAIELGWSAVTLDTDGLTTTIDRYVIYRGTSAYFTPTETDSVGATDALTLTFTDNDIGGVNVVGDTLVQYFYVVAAVDTNGYSAAPSNRVGEYDYELVVTATTNYNLVGIPFANTGIATAVDLISAIGSANVLTVNNFKPSSQNFESRFAAGFGVNFVVVPGRVYQINAAVNSIFSVAGSVPDSGSISYPLITTSITDFNFMMIPFELESQFAVAQDVIDYIPGVLNTLNKFVAASQSYVARFAPGFGTNFPVKAGKPYQANVAVDGAFPGP
ncbi:MAG: Ig-like domain-containing protein, partial [candidate division Zixibacteria bacterium]|nr:Ig-like domain-containing protein [candidate division Zixibacteria bacterium]